MENWIIRAFVRLIPPRERTSSVVHSVLEVVFHLYLNSLHKGMLRNLTDSTVAGTEPMFTDAVIGLKPEETRGECTALRCSFAEGQRVSCVLPQPHLLSLVRHEICLSQNPPTDGMWHGQLGELAANLSELKPTNRSWTVEMLSREVQGRLTLLSRPVCKLQGVL